MFLSLIIFLPRFFFFLLKPQPVHVSTIARGARNAGGDWLLDRSGTLRLRQFSLVCPGPGNGLFVYPRIQGHNGVFPHRVLFQAGLW